MMCGGMFTFWKRNWTEKKGISVQLKRYKKNSKSPKFYRKYFDNDFDKTHINQHFYHFSQHLKTQKITSKHYQTIANPTLYRIITKIIT